MEQRMKTYLRFNPSVCSINIGDQIIAQSVIEQMKWLFSGNFVIDVSSHQPISWIYYSHVLQNVDLSFVMGSNLLRGKLNSVDRQWDINIFNAKQLGPAVLIGVGWRAYGETPNWYTRQVYQKILSHNYMHSVRDNYTKDMLQKIGFNNVVNTSCATMWGFTPEFCRKIPTTKADTVVTTVTDYNQNLSRDKAMIDCLKANYKKVFLWVQGIGDYQYIKELTDINDICIIEPSLIAFDRILMNTDIDYIGTRLHGGIRALQKGRRTLIVGIDNRAKEKERDFNLPVIDQNEIYQLVERINQPFDTKIRIPLHEIEEWKAQFRKNL
ncbi:polysaccharide pyruvyl transferase family protein [Parabacteroides goldsteinii]|uniref:polysaccharide pyruvyl transferase family protein n=1 Tax=Parabacteroides goldsteinii TaxID=328812 RepID=UPI001E5BDBEC|nr:polysaccharide pyruvyl transferase family protein [Parabacteroides goldsteinii]